MAYNRSIYLKAREIMDSRRSSAEREQEMRHSAAIVKCPEILEIEREMASGGADVIKAVGMGGDVKSYVNNLKMKNLAAQDKRKAALVKGNFPEDYLETKYQCPVCKDTGFHDGFYCECYKKLIRQVARDELAANSPLNKSTFESFSLNYYPDLVDKVLGISQKEHMTNIFEYCKAYAEDFSRKSNSIIMLGQTGLGKTHLSLAIANKVLEKGYDVYYNSIQTIMNSLEKEHFGRLSNEDSIRDEVLSCDLLIIDDMGVEFSTQFTVSEIHNIVNTRLLKGIPTIINTNLTMKELEERYGQRIASRIIGSSIPLQFCGKDIRQQK